jgi:hypothetical protein
VIKTLTFNITYDQAMRNVDDADNSGKPDYYFNGDVTLTGINVSGQLFWDLDSSSAYSALTDEIIVDATVVVENTTSGFRAENISTESGFALNGVPPMNADLYAIVNGHKSTVSHITIGTTNAVTQNIAIKPGSISNRDAFQQDRGSSFPITINGFTNGPLGRAHNSPAFSFGAVGRQLHAQSGAGITLGNGMRPRHEKIVIR